MFPGPDSKGLYGAEWDERLCSFCTFQPFLVFTLGSSKIEVFETYFYDIVIT